MKVCLIICCAMLLALADSASVPGAVQQKEGCYWTDCTSPFTYNLKCRSDFQDEGTTDKSNCEGSLVKFQCCPADPSNPGAKPDQGSDSEGSVVPQAV